MTWPCASSPRRPPWPSAREADARSTHASPNSPHPDQEPNPHTQCFGAGVRHTLRDNHRSVYRHSLRYMTTISPDLQHKFDDTVDAMLTKAAEILDPQHAPIGDAAINYARACSELVAAIAATATARAANQIAGLTETAVDQLNNIHLALRALEPPE